MITLIILKEEMKDIMKIVKSLELSGLLVKGANTTIENEAEEQKGGFLSFLLDTLGASYWEVCYQIKDLFELVKEQLEKVRIYNAASSFN